MVDKVIISSKSALQAKYAAGFAALQNAIDRLIDADATRNITTQCVWVDDAAAVKDRTDLLQIADELATFADTAAVIANLDLVISVDTSVAHLAGAMAKTVWILLPHTPDWRWLLGRNTSTWYPTARLFRQAAPGDWDEVTGRVAAELEVLVARSGTGRAPE